MARRRRVLLAGLVALLALIVGEVGFRAVKRTRYRSVAAAWDHELFAMHPERDYVHRLLPDRRRTNEIPGREERWTYTTNAAGLRGAVPGARGEGARRVLALGDSYTFGWAVDDEQAYPFVLEQLLNEPDAEGRPPRAVEVINAGTPGYNTHQQAAFLDEIWDEMRPDLVVLGFVMNDAEPPRVVPPPPDVLYGFAGSWLWEDVKKVINRLVPGERPLLASRLFERGPYLEQFGNDRPERRMCREALGRIATRCKRASVPLVVFIFPEVSRLGEAYEFEPVHALVRQWGSELSVPTFDLLQAFRGAGPKQHIVRGDGHPNGGANRIFATEIAQVVRSMLGR